MSVLRDILQRVERYRDGMESGSLIRGVLEAREGDIMELQQRQLLEGKSSSGENLRPFYSEDLKPGGYFWSVETAGRYAAWKVSLSYPYEVTRENPDAPNLYINGRFFDELEIRFGSDSMTIAGGTMYAAGIVAKYGLSNFGLSDEKWEVFMTERGGLDAIVWEIQNILFYE